MPSNRRKSRPLTLRLLSVAVVMATLAAVGPIAGAHETDQFTVPTDRNFADLGPEFTEWYWEALDSGMLRANQRIADAIEAGEPSYVISELQSPSELVNAVDRSLLRGNDIVAAVEHELASGYLQRRHPGQRIYFREADANIYQHAFFLFDIRILSRFWFGSTVNLFGHYIGTDKFGHFTALGISYYWRYIGAKQNGASEREAMREAVRFGTTGPQSEDGIMGMVTTGDYANGDLSANYSGFLFFRNLTEPTFVSGAVRPPLLMRSGPYWKLSPHVRPDSDFLRPFITDHWNEALNPGYFMESMRPALRAAVYERAPRVLQFYAPPKVSSLLELQRYFLAKRLELQTYWGQDYGHRGDDQSLVTIDNTCFAPR